MTPSNSDFRTIEIGDGVRVGAGEPMVLIAGPCVVEAPSTMDRIGTQLEALCRAHAVPLIFKASYAKDNRSSGEAYRGPGLATGLAELARLRQRLRFPVVTDVHRVEDVAAVAAAVDLVQIPALLARQSSLLEAVADAAEAVHLKKGQTMTSEQLRLAVQKLQRAGARRIIATERGSSWSPGQLVCDFGELARLGRVCGTPIGFDAGHCSNQRGDIVPLALAAAAVGVDALFVECHHEPAQARCDGSRTLSLAELGAALPKIVELARIARRIPMV